MVVELVVLRQGFAKLNGGGGGVGEGEGCALDEVLLPSLIPSIYRAKGVRESWIRGSSDSRTIYFGRTVGL